MTAEKDFSKMWDFYQNENRHCFHGAVNRLTKLTQGLKKYKVAPQAKILDIGFGDGTLLELLYDAGYEPYGIDFAKQNVEISEKTFKEKGKKIHVQYGDIQEIPFEDGFFEVVMASETLEHLDNDVLTKGVKEVKRVLKKGGRFVVTVPYQENLEEDLTACPHCNEVFHRWGHQQSFNDEKLKNLFEGEGFKIVALKGVNFLNTDTNLFGKAAWVLKSILKKHKNYFVLSENP